MKAAVTAVAAAAALSFAGQASATIYSLQLNGTIKSGQDVAGYFLPGGGSLTGLPFKAIFFTDDQVYHWESDDGFESRIAGSAGSTTAQLFINGAMVKFGVPAGTPGSLEDGGFASQRDDGTVEFYRRYTDSFRFNPDVSFTFFRMTMEGRGDGWDFLRSHQWRDLTTAEANAAPVKTGSFDIWFSNLGPYSTLAAGTFDITSVRTWVPEPSAWMLLIGGFGLTGAMLRRRRLAAA